MRLYYTETSYCMYFVIKYFTGENKAGEVIHAAAFILLSNTAVLPFRTRIVSCSSFITMYIVCSYYHDGRASSVGDEFPTGYWHAPDQWQARMFSHIGQSWERTCGYSSKYWSAVDVRSSLAKVRNRHGLFRCWLTGGYAGKKSSCWKSIILLKPSIIVLLSSSAMHVPRTEMCLL